jgi:hypothetical protein
VGLDLPAVTIDEYFEHNDPCLLISCTTSGSRTIETAAQMAAAGRAYAANERSLKKKEAKASASLKGETRVSKEKSKLKSKPGRKVIRMSLTKSILQDSTPMSPDSQLFDPQNDHALNPSAILDAVNFDGSFDAFEVHPSTESVVIMCVYFFTSQHLNFAIVFSSGTSFRPWHQRV